MGRVRGARGYPRRGRDARHHAADDRSRDRLVRRRGVSGAGFDRRCGRGREARLHRARLVRRVDAEGALPHRGEEDDGVRARRTARVEAAGRHRLPDRWRCRPHRHVERVRGAARDRLDRARRHAAIRRGAGDGLRADRACLRVRCERVGAMAGPEDIRRRHPRSKGARGLSRAARAPRELGHRARRHRR